MATKKGKPAARPRTTPATTAGTKPAARRSLKVEAIKIGFYDMKRRRPAVDDRPGDVFTLSDPRHFSKRWMRWVDPETPERVSSSADALTSERQRIKREKAVERANPNRPGAATTSTREQDEPDDAIGDE